MKTFFEGVAIATILLLPFALWFNNVELSIAIVSFWFGAIGESYLRK